MDDKLNHGAEAGEPEGVNSDASTDHDLETPGGEMLIPKPVDAPDGYARLADAVVDSGRVDGEKHDADTSPANPDDTGEEVVDGRAELMDAYKAVRKALDDRRARGIRQYDATEPLIDLRPTDGGGAAKLDIAGVPDEPPRASENPEDE